MSEQYTRDLIAGLRKAHDEAGRLPQGTMEYETQWRPFANLYNAADALLDALEATLPNNRKNCPGNEGHAGCGGYCMVCDLEATLPSEDERGKLIAENSEYIDTDDWGRGYFFTSDALDMFADAILAAGFSRRPIDRDALSQALDSGLGVFRDKSEIPRLSDYLADVVISHLNGGE